jgi:hypothetical protein
MDTKWQLCSLPLQRSIGASDDVFRTAYGRHRDLALAVFHARSG